MPIFLDGLRPTMVASARACGGGAAPRVELNRGRKFPFAMGPAPFNFTLHLWRKPASITPGGDRSDSFNVSSGPRQVLRIMGGSAAFLRPRPAACRACGARGGKHYRGVPGYNILPMSSAVERRVSPATASRRACRNLTKCAPD